MSTRIVAIDPGKTGGVAVLDGPILVSYLKTPMLGKEYDLQAMAAFLQLCRGSDRPTPVRGVIEKVGAFPGQGVTAMFTFGVGVGLWWGMMAAYRIPFDMVLPRQWQSIVPALGGLDKPDRKKAIIAWARRMWPAIPNHSGICEAAAMAEWLRRREA